jgi:NADPH:quinone reductase-like Zn-dependent oxidoreductase
MPTSWLGRLDDLLDGTVVGSFTNVGHAVRSVGWQDGLPSMDGKTAIVTGTTSGLGRAAAERLARLGAGVRLVGRSQAKLDRARAEVFPLPVMTISIPTWPTSRIWSR